MRTRRRRALFTFTAALVVLTIPASTLLPAPALAAPPAYVAQDDKPEEKPPSAQTPIVGLDAFNKMLADLGALLPDLIKDRPTGEDSQREAAFKTLNALWAAAIATTIGLPVAGAGIGLVCDICLLGTDMGAGTLAGGLIGGGVAVVNFAVWAVVITALSFDINDKYPPDEKAAAGATRGFRTVSFEPAAAFAGPYESQMIHLLDILTPDSVIRIARFWDRTPGLDANQRSILAAHRWLQPTIQKLAYLKQNLRFSPTAPPAMPRSGWLETVNTLLSPETSAEQRWLTALGLGSMSASMTGSALVLQIPPALQTVGAPAQVRANMPGFSVKVGGTGGALDPYIRTSLLPANFRVSLGSASIIRSGPDRDKIRLSCSIARNSSVGRAALRFKWNGPESTLADFQPRLTVPVNGSLFFRVEGDGIVLDKVQLGNMSFSLGLPKDFPKMPGLDQLIADLTKGISTELSKMMAGMPWATLFQPFQQFPSESLQKDLEKRAYSYGLYEVKDVRRLALSGGKLQAEVRGVKLKLRDPGISPQQVAAVVQASSSRLPNLRPAVIPGALTPTLKRP